MKICIITNTFSPDLIGGSNIYTSTIAKELHKRNHEVIVIAGSQNKKDSIEIFDGIKIYYFYPFNICTCSDIGKKAIFWQGLWTLLDIYNPYSYKKIIRILKKENPNVVHLHTPFDITLSSFDAIKKMKLPIVFTANDHLLLCRRISLLHNSGEICTKDNVHIFCKLYRKITRNVVGNKADIVFFPSQYLLQKFEDHGLFLNSKKIVLPYPIKLDHVNNYKTNTLNKNKKLRILYVGGLTKYKGIHILIEAIKQIKSNDISLMIIGAGRYKSSLEDLAGADTRITFVGSIRNEDIASYYKQSDVLVLPSIFFEIFGIVILEAFRAGLPVIASRIGGITEVVKNNFNGFLFDAGNVCQLKNILETILKNKSILVGLGENAKNCVQQYEVSRHMEKLIQNYEEAIRLNTTGKLFLGMSKKDDLKRIVISAINFTEGGPLSVFKECLDYLSSELADLYEIIVLVNDETIFDYKNLSFYSFPKSKKSWLIRLYYEYFYFYNLSKKIKPHLWFSLHDITPNVESVILATYCQNDSPFYSLSVKDVFLGGYKFILFNLFYRYLYAINIKKNDFVVVQQDSLRNKISQFARGSKIVVAYPTIVQKTKFSLSSGSENIFFYPAFPRVFKNVEVICKAAKILLKQGINNFQVLLTMSGDENRYSKYIYRSFKSIKNIKFLGILSRERIFELYNKASCIIFPSKLETWGMPITEAKLFSKPILLSNFEYAYETLGEYDKAKFFDPNNPEQLACYMKDIMNQSIIYDKTRSLNIKPPFAKTWRELFDILLKGK